MRSVFSRNCKTTLLCFKFDKLIDGATFNHLYCSVFFPPKKDCFFSNLFVVMIVVVFISNLLLCYCVSSDFPTHHHLVHGLNPYLSLQPHSRQLHRRSPNATLTFFSKSLLPNRTTNFLDLFPTALRWNIHVNNKIIKNIVETINKVSLSNFIQHLQILLYRVTK